MELRAEVRELLNERGGLIPVIAQDNKSGKVLMLAWMNEEAFERTIRTGKATYWSRSRNELWEKGATSGNTQEVTEISIDCDGDSILLKVNQLGPACHTGQNSCFHTSIELDLK